MSCHTGAYPLRPSLLASLSGLSFGFGPFNRSFVVSVRVGTAPILIGHLLVSLSLCFRDRTYINRSFSMSVCVFGTAPISIGHHLVSLGLCFRDRTYINWSFSVSVCVFETVPISIGHFLCQYVFSGPHLYRSVMFLSLSCSVRVGTTPISIGHHLVRLGFCVFGTTPISIGHFPCQFVSSGPHPYRSAIFLSVCFYLESGLHPYRSVIHLINSVRRPGSLFSMTFRVTFQFWHSKPLCILIQAFLGHHVSSILGT